MYLWTNLRVLMIAFAPYQFSCVTFFYLWHLSTVNSRFTSNENLFFWLSYFWTTSETLLPLTLIATLFYWTHWGKVKGGLVYYASLLPCLMIVYYELSPVNNTTTPWLLSETCHVENIFLLNKLNKIHPPLFYLMWGFITGGIFQVYQHRFAVQNCLSPSVTVAILLVLGAWWAFQEGTWGGWWNWDASEILAYLLFLVALLHVHQKFSRHSEKFKWIFFIKTQLDIMGVVIFFAFLQLSFSLSSHSFGIQFTHLFSTDLIFVNAIILLFIRKLLCGQNLMIIDRNLRLCFSTAQTLSTLIFNALLVCTCWILVTSLSSIIPITLGSFEVLKLNLKWFSPITAYIHTLMWVTFIKLCTRNAICFYSLLILAISSNPIWVILKSPNSLNNFSTVLHFFILFALIFSLSAQSGMSSLYELELRTQTFQNLMRTMTVNDVKTLDASTFSDHHLNFMLILVNVDGFSVLNVLIVAILFMFFIW